MEPKNERNETLKHVIPLNLDPKDAEPLLPELPMAACDCDDDCGCDDICLADVQGNCAWG